MKHCDLNIVRTRWQSFFFFFFKHAVLYKRRLAVPTLATFSTLAPAILRQIGCQVVLHCQGRHTSHSERSPALAFLRAVYSANESQRRCVNLRERRSWLGDGGWSSCTRTKRPCAATPQHNRMKGPASAALMHSGENSKQLDG